MPRLSMNSQVGSGYFFNKITHHQFYRYAAIAASAAASGYVLYRMGSYLNGRREMVVSVSENGIPKPDTIIPGFIEGDEFQVNLYTTGDQITPSVASLTNGNFVIAWSSNGQDTSLLGVFARIFSSNGMPLTSEFQVNTYTTDNQNDSHVSELSNGNFIIVWTQANSDFSTADVYGRIFTNNGTAVTGEFSVNETLGNKQNQAAVTHLSAGNFVVTWQSLSQDGSQFGSYGRIFNSVGAAVTSEFLINTYTTSNQYSPVPIGLSNGEYAVVWASFGQDTSDFGIYGRLFADDSPSTGEFIINSYTTGEQSNPFLAAFSNGNFIVTWRGYGENDVDVGVYGRIFDVNGSPVSGADIQINTYTAGLQHYPTVANLANDNFIIVWESSGQDGSGSGLYGRLFNSNGSPITAEVLINSYTQGDQGGYSRGHVASLDSGGFVVTWESSLQDGSEHGIYAKIFSPVFSPATPPPPFNPKPIYIVLGIAAVVAIGATALLMTRKKVKKNHAEAATKLTRTEIDLTPVVQQNPVLAKLEPAGDQLANIIPSIPSAPLLSLTTEQQEQSVHNEAAKIIVATPPAVEDLSVPVPLQYQQLISPEPSHEEQSISRRSTLSIDYLIPYQSLSFGEVLGQGAYGVVTQGTWQSREVAIKQLLLTTLSEKAKEEFENEAQVMARLRHPSVVEFYGASIDQPGKYSLVMELMPEGNLYNLLHNNQPLTWDIRLRIAGDITAGLEHLHSKGILHRDLKSLNVLLGHGMRAKLTDFGLAKIKAETASKTMAEEGPSKGTVAWMAPEQFKREYTEKSDIYSYGMVLWELVSRAIPYEDATSAELVIAWIKDSIHEKIPEDCPPRLAKLITWCWNKEPSARPTSSQAAMELNSVEVMQVEQPVEIEQPEDKYHHNLDTGFGS